MIAYTYKIDEILGDRMDARFYHPQYFEIIKAIKKVQHYQLGQIAEFSNESWNQKDLFEEEFPYIEIGAIDNITGTIKNINYIPIEDAPSRAKKIVRKNDILISTTRPSRGAITQINEDGLFIASTGFAVVRNISNIVLREYLNVILRFPCSLLQMEQRSSGGNYPAITENELRKIILPIPNITVQQNIVECYNVAKKSRLDKYDKAKTELSGIDLFMTHILAITEIQDFVLDKLIQKNISELIGNRLDVSFHKKCFDMCSRIYPNKKLSALVDIDPSIKFPNDPEMEISFIPMECIDEVYGEVAEQQTTLISKSKGYTKFEEGDLLWAKITPCMQNGKSAIAKNLTNGMGCGSTEYYVMRPKSNDVMIEYVYLVLRHKEVLRAAQNSFGGSAGQQRVSIQYMKSIMIPLPPIEVQREVVKSIETMKLQAKRLQAEGTKQLEDAKQKIVQFILE